MSYIGLDPSLSGFGFAVIYSQDDYATETMAFPPKIYGDGVNRLKAIRRELLLRIHAVQARGPILHVCMEGYAYGAQSEREKLGELGGMVKDVLYDELNPPARWPTIVPPTSLKKFVLGDGAGKKADMKLGIYKKWGADFSIAKKDDNQADAFGLAKMAYALVHGAHLGYEKDVLAKLKMYTEKPITIG